MDRKYDFEIGIDLHKRFSQIRWSILRVRLSSWEILWLYIR